MLKKLTSFFVKELLFQEREDFERSQSNAMVKCLSLDEAPPKEKHVRTLILGTYRTRYELCSSLVV